MIEAVRTLRMRPFTLPTLFAAEPERVHLAPGAGAELLTYGARSGRLERRVSLPIQGDLLTDQVRAAWREQQLADLRRSATPAVLEAQSKALEGMPYPERMPVFRRLFVDRDGRLWAERYAAPGAAGREYLVLGADGKLLMRVTGPSRAAFQDAKGDTVLVRWRDSDDKDQVLVFRLLERE
jgi:hypothetical protein